MKRIVLGFIFAPIASGLLQGALMGNLGAPLFALLFAYPFSIVLGVPTFIFFQKNGWLKLWQVLLAGTTLAIMGGYIFSIIVGNDGHSIQSIIQGLGAFGLHGLVVSLSFWVIAIKQFSSNKSFKPTPKSGAV